jgi:hypothetical protein
MVRHKETTAVSRPEARQYEYKYKSSRAMTCESLGDDNEFAGSAGQSALESPRRPRNIV